MPKYPFEPYERASIRAFMYWLIEETDLRLYDTVEGIEVPMRDLHYLLDKYAEHINAEEEAQAFEQGTFMESWKR